MLDTQVTFLERHEDFVLVPLLVVLGCLSLSESLNLLRNGFINLI
jgi:hypothetical protein